MNEREALKLALEALEYPLNQSHENFNVDMAELLSHRAITAIEEALAQSKQEPVAWLIEYEVCAGGRNRGSSLKKFDYVWDKFSFVSEDKDAEIEYAKWRNRKETPLYTTPPQRTWVGLTDIDYAGLPLEQVGLVRWAEAKLKEKNT